MGRRRPRLPAPTWHGYIELHSIDPAQNRVRVYQLVLMPDLLGYWVAQSSWGRIGKYRRTANLVFAIRQEAETAGDDLVQLRLRHGYHVVYVQ